MAAIFFGKLEIFEIGNDLLGEACSVVSFTIFFKYDLSLLPLIGFDDQLLVIFEKQTLYLFSPTFVITCSNLLPLLKSIIAK